MSISVTKYKLYCNTEQKWVEGWGDVLPTTCFNDTSHNININSIRDIYFLDENIIKIKEESITTGGNLQLDSHTFDISASGTTGDVTIYESTYPMPINMISLTACPTTKNIGDSIVADIGHHTTIGILTEDIASGITGGITGFSVSDSVLEYLNIGYLVTLSTGITSCELGRCVMIDKKNKKISTEYPTTMSFSASTPTYVQQTVQMIRNLDFPESTIPIIIGDDKIGSSYVPKNIIGRIKYTNNDGKAKKFTFYIEYLY